MSFEYSENSATLKTTEPKVELLSMTPNALAIIYAACKQCYSLDYADNIYNLAISGKISKEEQEKLIRKVLSAGHESVCEHVSFTFAISGISRVTSHQLVRHRIASYSQQSQRHYIDMANISFIIPPTIRENSEALRVYEDTIKYICESYKRLVTILSSNGINKKEASEDARFILPNAIETRIVVTMNCRSLLNFFSLRCCNRAQWEIRNVAYQMLDICKAKLPVVFEKAGPKCIRLGYCPEIKPCSDPPFRRK